MKGHARITMLAGRAIALAWLLAGPVPAAEPRTDQELDEVTVTGTRSKPVRNLQTIIEWLARLVGQYRYGGTVELRAGPGIPTAPLLVRGVGDCVAFGLAPGVQCSIAVSWPKIRGEGGQEVLGGVSTLNPAMVLYGLDPDRRAIHFLQVDQKGIADGGTGYLMGDTLTTRAPCEGIPGDCERITTIDAQPDGRRIQMQVDIEQDGQRAVRFNFVLNRTSEPAKSGSAAVPKK